MMDEIIQIARNRVKDLYDIEALEVPIYFKKEGLSFFEGGSTWNKYDGTCFIQIHPDPPFFYKQEEILAHELVHAARNHLNGKKFEEFVAYKTSKSKIRAFLGTLVERSFEVYLFLFSLPFQYLFLPLPWLLLGLSCVRALRRQFQWKRAKTTLQPHLKPGIKPEFVLVRLTDQEIIALGFSMSAIEKKRFSQYLQSSPLV